MYCKLQYISQGLTGKEQLLNIQKALDAGCGWIQLRFKNGKSKELYNLAEKVKKICSSYHSVFIMNDHAYIAKAIDADGVHLGLLDMPVAETRAIVGENKIIGGTANTIYDVMKRINEKCDYIGLGPFRFTTTKEKLSPVLGIDGLTRVMNKALSVEKDVRVYAIGGITLDDISAIMKTRVAGVAVSGVITNSRNKKEWIRKFKILSDEEFGYCR